MIVVSLSSKVNLPCRANKEKKQEKSNMSGMDLDIGIKGFKRGTNIRDIVVPEHLRRKATCGISWIDEAMGGKGFTPSTCGMLTGTPGAGKTTLLMQLADSITRTGNVCLFNTGEESLHQVAMTSERLKLSHGFMAGQDVIVPDLLQYADNIMAEEVTGKTRGSSQDPRTLFILVDSLQTMNDGKYKDGGTTGATPKRVAKMFTEYTKEKKDVVLLFIGQVTKSGEFSGQNVIKHMIDMHLHLYIDDDKRSETWGERIFTNYKNRFGCAGRTYVLGMDESGLWKKGQFHPEERGK